MSKEEMLPFIINFAIPKKQEIPPNPCEPTYKEREIKSNV